MTTTTATTQTTAVFHPQPTVELLIGIKIVFTQALNNPQSEEFKALAATVAQAVSVRQSIGSILLFSAAHYSFHSCILRSKCKFCKIKVQKIYLPSIQENNMKKF